MPVPGPLELGIIAVLVLVLFGAGKISGIGKDLGNSIKEFRKAVKDEDDPKKKAAAAAAMEDEPPPAIAQVTTTPPAATPQATPPTEQREKIF